MKLLCTFILTCTAITFLFSQENPDKKEHFGFSEKKFKVEKVYFQAAGVFVDTLSSNVIQSNQTMLCVTILNKDKDCFCSYPSVQAITNEKGDTLAVGMPEYYGQAGNSLQNYHLKPKTHEFPIEGKIYIHFGSMLHTYWILPYEIKKE